MSMKRSIVLLICVLTIGPVRPTGPAHALNVQTHALVNQVAAQNIAMDAFLKSEIGLLRGIEESVRRRTVVQWLGEGGIREDDNIRFLSHFHDPLHGAPWTTAGLGGLFESSIRWMQRDGTQSWSWQRARQHFATALMSTDPLEREQAWADTFRALGQLMHLVVDASVPEHVRNDAHPGESICRHLGRRCFGSYEYWLSDAQGANPGSFRATYLSVPVSFDPVILRGPTGDGLAPVPVARLIDADMYDGSDPNITATNPAIGLAEFANANFFSEDTATGGYPFPDWSRLVPSRHPAPRTGRIRAYFAKGAGDGIAVDPAVAECVLYEAATGHGVVEPISRRCADERVWDATASHVLPRAVGYARGLLDYFLRGRIEIAPPARYAYGLAAWEPDNTGAFTKLRFKIRNATPGEDAAQGTVVAVVRHRRPNGDLIRDPVFTPLSAPVFAVSAPMTVTLTREYQEFLFDFDASPIPTNSADLFLTVVYRGPLGRELDAVAVGGRDLFEPDPFDRANSTDYDCFDGTIFPVSSLPPFMPPTETRRDVNQDGVQDLFGPWTERDTLAKTFDLNRSVVFPSDENADAVLPRFDFARFSRFMILQDEPFYGVSLVRRELIEFSTGTTFHDLREAWANDGIVNEIVLGSGGRLIRRATLSGVYRSVPTLHIFLLLSSTNMLGCASSTADLGPSLTLAPSTVPAEWGTLP
jgi:hypothetical protein